MYRRQKIGCGCTGKIGCGCIGESTFSSADRQELAILDRQDPSSSVFSMLPMDSAMDSEYALTQGAEALPVQPTISPMQSAEKDPCPKVDCSKCPVKIVEKKVIVPGTTKTVTQYVYVTVPGTISIPSGGFSQSELESIYRSSGGIPPSSALPDESAGEGNDYGQNRSDSGDSKPFPWWLLGIGAAAYFLAKKQRNA